MDLESTLWHLQQRMIDNMPSDYQGNQIQWEMNVIYWIMKAYQAIKEDSLSLETVEFIADSLDGGHSLKAKH